MAVVQSTYSERMKIAAAGLIATQRETDSITRNCEGASGIGFGLAVGRGDNDSEKNAKVGGTVPDFLGVTIRDVTLEAAAAASTDKYLENNNMGILTEGEIWVEVTGTPDADDPVHFNATTGVFAASGGSGPLLGARFMGNTITSQVGGKTLCKLHLSNYNQAAA